MKRITLYRNPDCNRCRKISRIHQRFDWFGRLECSDEPPAEVGALRMGEIAVVDARDGSVLRGLDAVRRVCREIPAYAPFRLLLRVPPVARRVDRMVRGEAEAACELPRPSP